MNTDEDDYDLSNISNAIKVEMDDDVVNDNVSAIVYRASLPSSVWTSGLSSVSGHIPRRSKGPRKAIYHTVCQQTKGLALRINGFVCTARAAEQRVRLAKSEVFRQTFEAMPDVFAQFQLNRQMYYVKCPPELIDCESFQQEYKSDLDSYTMFYHKELGAELKNKMSAETKSAILSFAHSHFANRIKLSKALQDADQSESTAGDDMICKLENFDEEQQSASCSSKSNSLPLPNNNIEGSQVSVLYTEPVSNTVKKKRTPTNLHKTNRHPSNLHTTDPDTVSSKQSPQEAAPLEESLLSRIASKIQINVIVKTGKRPRRHHYSIKKKIKVTSAQEELEDSKSDEIDQDSDSSRSSDTASHICSLCKFKITKGKDSSTQTDET